MRRSKGKSKRSGLVLEHIEQHQNIKNYVNPIDYDLTKEEYFNLLLSMKGKKNEEYTRLLYGYLLLLDDFITNLKKQTDKDRFQETLYEISQSLQFERWPANRLLMRMGEEGKKFYLILYGRIDVLIPSERKETIQVEEYLRYLAKLIYYNEIELFNKAINANSEIYPLELSDTTYGKITKINTLILSDIPTRKLNLTELLEFLTEDELNQFNKRMRIERKRHKETDNGVILSSQDYIARLNDYSLINKENPKEIKQLITATIIDYTIICSLESGQYFGDTALGTYHSKRTATILTSSDCYFGSLNSSSYNSLLKAASDKYRYQLFNFILSLGIFEGFSLKKLQSKYFNSFVLYKVKKNEILITENCKSDNIIILKEGTFEITSKRSLVELTEIILHYYNYITKSHFKKKEDEHFIRQNIKQLKEENNKLMAGAKSIESLNKFYKQKHQLKIYLIDSPDTFGMTGLDYVNKTSLYDLKIASPNAEIFTLPKNVFDNICSYDWSLRDNQRRICYEKNIKLIKRILDIRKSILSLYFQTHQINKFLDLDIYNMKSDGIISSDIISKSNSNKRVVNIKVISNRTLNINPKANSEGRDRKNRKKTINKYSGSLFSFSLKDLWKSSRNANRNNSLKPLGIRKDPSDDKTLTSSCGKISSNIRHIITGSLFSRLNTLQTKTKANFPNPSLSSRTRNKSLNVVSSSNERFDNSQCIREYTDIFKRVDIDSGVRRCESSFNMEKNSITKYILLENHANDYIIKRNMQVIDHTRSTFLRFKKRLIFRKLDNKKCK